MQKYLSSYIELIWCAVAINWFAYSNKELKICWVLCTAGTIFLYKTLHKILLHFLLAQLILLQPNY